MVEADADLPLSPELVLVAPEFGEHALVQVPNGRPPPAPAPPPELPAQAPPPPAPAPPAPPAPALPSPAAPAAAEPSPVEAARGWRLTVGGATAIVLSAIVVFGAGFLIGQFLLPESTSQPGTAQQAAPPQTTLAAITEASVTEVATPRPRASAPTPSKTVATPPPTQQAKPTAPKATPSPKPKPRPKPAPRTVRPLPSGGYVLPGGRFQVSRNGRAISGFTLDRTCAGPVVLPPIEVEPTGAFAFTGRVPGSQATVQVKGRFVTPTEARGTTLVRGTECRAPATSFVARLS